MSGIKKKEQRKTGAKERKLQLNKETLKDLSARNSGRVKGGARASRIDACDTRAECG